MRRGFTNLNKKNVRKEIKLEQKSNENKNRTGIKTERE